MEETKTQVGLSHQWKKCLVVEMSTFTFLIWKCIVFSYTNKENTPILVMCSLVQTEGIFIWKEQLLSKFGMVFQGIVVQNCW